MMRLFTTAVLLVATTNVSAFAPSRCSTNIIDINNVRTQSTLLWGAPGDDKIMPLPAGSMVALVTPMKEDGSLDEDALRDVLNWHKDEGTNGIVILGTTGEASTLTKEEKDTVMKITREEVGGVLPIVVGTGTIDTQATITNTLQAKANGADAALIVTPYYVKPSQNGLLQHFFQ